MTLRQRILLLGLVAILGMLGLLWQQYGAYKSAGAGIESFRRNVTTVGVLSRVAHALQKERGLSLILGAHAETQELREQIHATDLDIAGLAETGMDHGSFKASLDQARCSTAEPFARMAAYTELVRELLDEMERLNHEPGAVVAAVDIAAHAHLAAAKEYLGQMRAILGYWLATRVDKAGAYARLIQLKALHDEEIRKFGLDASPEMRAFFSRQARERATGPVFNLLAEVVTGGNPPSDLDEKAWWSMATMAVDCLKADEDHSLGLIDEKVEVELARLRRGMRFIMFATLAATGIVIVLAATLTASLLRGLHHIRSGMAAIAASRDFQRRLPAEAKDEIGSMARSFNQLLDIVASLLAEKDALATTDPLTGISNRMRLGQTLDDELARRQRIPAHMAVILFDIDHFKSINDGYGHNVGDDVLRSLAGRVAASIRNTDLFARWGGEEFILLLRDDTGAAAAAVAEKLRRIIADTDFPPVGRVTCSFGVAAWRPGDTERSLVGRADLSLYEAKKDGRNLVVVAPA